MLGSDLRSTVSIPSVPKSSTTHICQTIDQMSAMGAGVAFDLSFDGVSGKQVPHLRDRSLQLLALSEFNELIESVRT